MTLAIAHDRHPSTQHFADLFDYEHLPAPLQGVSAKCHTLAQSMIDELGDGPELSAGLRSLLQAKDAFVRQSKKDRG
ncbi:MAG TPA: hypothetical protein VGN19_03745 [Pedococcus sp.]|jgi:hypothetical protein|nr:hypothetical protein [Pedococcus sp.]